MKLRLKLRLKNKIQKRLFQRNNKCKPQNILEHTLDGGQFRVVIVLKILILTISTPAAKLNGKVTKFIKGHKTSVGCTHVLQCTGICFGVQQRLQFGKSVASFVQRGVSTLHVLQQIGFANGKKRGKREKRRKTTKERNHKRNHNKTRTKIT